MKLLRTVLIVRNNAVYYLVCFLLHLLSLCGDAGYRSPYFSHAKRALYHLSYTPQTGSSLFCSTTLTFHYNHLNSLTALPTFHLTNAAIFKKFIIEFSNGLNPLPVLKVRFGRVHTFDSSVGRAVDCRCGRVFAVVIHRSLVQLRLKGISLCSLV